MRTNTLLIILSIPSKIEAGLGVHLINVIFDSLFVYLKFNIFYTILMPIVNALPKQQIYCKYGLIHAHYKIIYCQYDIFNCHKNLV